MSMTAGLIAFLATTEPVVAHPTPELALPSVSVGTNPYRSAFGEFVDEAGTRDVISIPEGQDFIITSYRETGGDLELLRNDEVLIDDYSFRAYLSGGRAKLRVEGGATIRVRRTDSWSRSPYYIQGYFVASGGPHRFVSGRTPEGGTHPIWTADDGGRDFLVRTLVTTTSWCDVRLDGVSVSSDSFPFDTMGNNAISNGRGMMVVPAGSTLDMTHGMPGEACSYFIEGQYIER